MTDLEALKATARGMWASGDYDAVAEYILPAGRSIVRHSRVGPGDDVLDVACGTGNAALPAAQAGARVTGLDLTPELFDAGRARAAAAGVTVDWREGDAEALPFPDASFDVVLSTFGTMFAPRQEQTAAELARVLRPGGRLGLCNWTPDGGIGAFFRTIARHVPPPPDVPSPLAWGQEAHCRELFAGRGLDLGFSTEAIDFRFPSAAEAVGLYTSRFGPVVTAVARLRDQDRLEPFLADLTELYARHAVDGGEVHYPGEYLVVSAGRDHTPAPT